MVLTGKKTKSKASLVFNIHLKIKDNKFSMADTNDIKDKSRNWSKKSDRDTKKEKNNDKNELDLKVKISPEIPKKS